MDFFPVIMCGGSGTRLWPLSRPARPKQFIPLIGARSTFQQTALRLSKLAGARPPLIVAGVAHADWIRAELEAIGLEAEVLLEPSARDSGPAVAAAAAWIHRQNPEGVAVIVASDHHVPDDDAFVAAIEQAGAAAARGWIVTLGVQPTMPSIAYGYINAGEVLVEGEAVRRTAAFVEKPNLEKAAAYLEAGYLWNSGNFIATAATLLGELDLYEPAIAQAARRGVGEASRAGGDWRLGPSFVTAPKISLDYAVMERTDRAAILPVAFAWSDLGAWDAVWEASGLDASGNAGGENTHFVDARDCLVRVPEGIETAVIGARNLAIIADDKGLLICDLARSQGVKAVAEHFAVQSPKPGPRPPSEILIAFADRFDRWLRTSALPLWWSVGADHRRGGFYDLIDLTGRPVEGPRRARVQTRQTFVYAMAARLGFDGPWRQAAEHGLSYFASQFRRPDGLYRTKVGPDGASLDDAPYLYDQSFALMSMATLFRAAPDRIDLRTAAEALEGAIRQHMGHAAGGFKETGPHAFQANAQMHLLEAALAWSEADGDPRWLKLAGEVVDLALAKFIDPDGGFLREFFDADWRPAEGEDGRLVEPGHQFEWAWLMQRWALRTGAAPARAAAVRLFDAGMKGVDAKRSVAIDELHDDLTVRSARARLWPQTEFVKAALIIASDLPAAEAEPYLAAAAQGAVGLWGYLETETPGLWRDKLRPDGGYDVEPAPASSLYHIVGAILALTTFRDRMVS
jgi:mannose-1-phosphate guanylyltransferase/mannose-6-phosphate isomerase